MIDPHRTDAPRADDAAADPDRDARVEQLLLDGLDCYFAGRYEQAIDVWSRALFFDRGHSRARAYIDRARRALAERQRESEELLESGVAALRRGDHREARRLLQDAAGRDRASDEAIAARGHLVRIEPGLGSTGVDQPTPIPRRRVRPPLFRYRPPGISPASVFLAAAVVVAGAVWWAATSERLRQLVSGGPDAAAIQAAPSAPQFVPALPLRAETALTRARLLAAGGRLHDALDALDPVRPTDPQRGEADRLRAELQRRLISLTLPGEAAVADPGRFEAPVP